MEPRVWLELGTLALGAIGAIVTVTLFVSRIEKNALENINLAGQKLIDRIAAVDKSVAIVDTKHTALKEEVDRQNLRIGQLEARGHA